MTVFDSVAPPMVGLWSRVEVAVARPWRGWEVGVAGGLDLADYRSRETILPRLTRAAAPAISSGVARTSGPWRFSLTGRWLGGRETMRLVAPISAIGRLRVVRGWAELEPTEYNARVLVRSPDRTRTGLEAGITRRIAGGLGLLSLAGWTEDREHSESRIAPDEVDRWDENGWRVALAWEGSVSAALRLRIEAGWSDREGALDPFDLDEVILRHGERGSWGALRLVWERPEGWDLFGELGGGWSERSRFERVLALDTSIRGGDLGGAVGIQGEVGPGRLAVSAGFGDRGRRSRLPDPALMAPSYGAVVAPRLGLEAARLRPLDLQGRYRWPLRPGMSLAVHAGYRRVDLGNPIPVGAPSGERSVLTFGVGALWAGGGP